MTSSLIIPAWKASWCLERCLRSADVQTVAFDEILLGIDDCAETLNEASRLYGAVKTPLKVFHFTSHSGCYIIRNTLASAAKGDELFFFDADDEMFPGYHAAMNRFVLPQKGRPHRVNACSRVEKGVTERPIASRNNPCMFAMSRTLFLTMGGFEPWECDADTEFNQRCKQLNLPLKYVEKNIACEYKHPDSLTVRKATGFGSSLRKSYREVRKRRESKPVHNVVLRTADCTLLSADFLDGLVKRTSLDKPIEVKDPSETLTLILCDRAACSLPDEDSWFESRTVACLGTSWRLVRSFDIWFQHRRVRNAEPPSSVPRVTARDIRPLLGSMGEADNQIEVEACLYALCMNYPEVEIVGDLSERDRSFLERAAGELNKTLRIAKTAAKLEKSDEAAEKES